MTIDTGITLLTLIIAFAAAYFAWRNLKYRDIESHQTRPTIVQLNGYGKYVDLIITNNKPHPISIVLIVARKRAYGPIFIKSTPVKWNPRLEYKPANTPQDALANFLETPTYSITTQQTFLIEILEHVPGCVYKLCVTTTGGKCQSIYHSPLEPQASRSDIGDNNT
jgi:hypothetical protein